MRFYLLAVALSALVLVSAGCGATTSVPSPGPSGPASPPPSSIASPAPTDAASPTPSDLATPVPSADAHEVLLAVGTRGGRCVDGPCESVVLVDRDGRVHLAAKPPNELGVVSPDLMAALDAAIRTTDFAELFSHPFTGECPTAYDGQELVFEFATPDGVQRLASCTVEVDYDSPLFTAVRAAVGEFVPLVRLGKRYVYYIFLSWPVDGPFAATISPALKPHMQGKPCFKFSRVDSDRLWADWLSSRRACADIRILDESFDVPSSTPGPGCGGTSDG